MAQKIRDEEPVALATVISGGDVGAKMLVSPDAAVLGTLGHERLDAVVARDAKAELAAGRSGVRHYGLAGEVARDEVEVFIEAFGPPPQIWLFGAVDFTAAIGRVAKTLGYRVVVCDARSVFATAQRFPMADEIVVDWPHRLIEERGALLGPRDAICVLTHDAKFDVPAIMAALRTDVGYIGALGSRRTDIDRRERLRNAGATEAELERVQGPIGLDIGAATPEETGVATMAEIILLRSGRTGRPLTETEGSVHR